jgi:asparaginyl-tRNA synthetase
VVDSTGTIQIVLADKVAEQHTYAQHLVPESSMYVRGILSQNVTCAEIPAADMTSVRSTGVEILSSKNANYVLSLRHIYINEFRSHVSDAIRTWFKNHDSVDFSAPLITPTLLYEPSAAIHLANLHNTRQLFLSQCAGFYLEAGAHAHERVYNLGPSFRNESRTNRHSTEYWHIKAELCSRRLDDIISLVEIFLRDIRQATAKRGVAVRSMLGSHDYPEFEISFQRYTYAAAIQMLQQSGVDIYFGSNISKACEDRLTAQNGHQPIWITNKPRTLEPFPYAIDNEDKRCTMTADLIAPNGYGEICGVAEKSFERSALDERMAEKEKDKQLEIYGWVREMRGFGLVPHTAFGMGFERLLRWLCGNNHVKDVIPFPRIFGREPLP